jgi:magnesium-transporting ATPase (P-type)
MVLVVVGLGMSIGFEHFKTAPRCFQTSISAYYYTPVQAFFVGALIAIGACLISVRGNTDWEDTLLNLAGMFAPIVALVPTSGAGACRSVPNATTDRDVNVANNVFALLAVGLVGLVILGWLMFRAARRVGIGSRRPAFAGFVLAAVLWVVATVLFTSERHFFLTKAHFTAAISMFVCIFLVALFDGLEYKAKGRARSRWNRYTAIAVAMALASIVTGGTALFGWDYWVLAIEISLISLFALFWTLQTIELWNYGVRGTEPQPDN